MRANAQDWITGLIWRKGLGTSRADISGSGRQSCEPEFNYIGCEAERQKLEKPRFARFFYFVVFRSHSLLDFLESRVMKRKSINHCQSRSEMERWTNAGRNVKRSADVRGNARHFCDFELNYTRIREKGVKNHSTCSEIKKSLQKMHSQLLLWVHFLSWFKFLMKRENYHIW